MRNASRRLFLAAALTAAALPVLAATPPADALDAAVRARLGADFNGVVLLRGDRTAPPLVRAYGMARFDEQPNGTGTRYQIGSASKWIAAVTALRLVDQGKLSLDAPVGAYLAGMPAETAARVTLRHLLSNTSGIPNGVMDAFRKDKSVAALPLAPAEASVRFGSGPLAFAPGSKFDYSVNNTDMPQAALAAAGEALLGMTYE